MKERERLWTTSGCPFDLVYKTLTFTYDLVLSPVITHSLSDSDSEEVTFPEITSLIPGEMFLRYITKSKYNALNNVFYIRNSYFTAIQIREAGEIVI